MVWSHGSIRIASRSASQPTFSCQRCGERLQSDKRLERKLWCGNCRIVMDRDMVATVNLARRGRGGVGRSRPPLLLEAGGGAGEAVEGNPTPTGIPGGGAPQRTQQT